MSTTLASLNAEITNLIQDNSITDITAITDATARINYAVALISAGIRLPDGRTSRPLPELFQIDTVVTDTSLAYVDLPATYQRGLFYVADSFGEKVSPPSGGSYYSFGMFMKYIAKKDLSEISSIYRVAIKGKKIYYQGIPASETTLTLQFYRKPVDMVLDADEPDGIPEAFSRKLIVHHVCADIMGSMVEDGEQSNKMANTYHLNEFYKTMIDMVNTIGEDDDTPEFYGERQDNYSNYNAGICD